MSACLFAGEDRRRLELDVKQNELPVSDAFRMTHLLGLFQLHLPSLHCIKLEHSIVKKKDQQLQ